MSIRRPVPGAAALGLCWLCSLGGLPACSPPRTGPADMGPDLAGPPARLKRPSRSAAIAISDDDQFVAAVSPDDDRVYLLRTANLTTTAVQLATGAEPRSVAYAPDGSFWVANRGDGTLVRISGVGTTPTAGPPLQVCSEPTGLALTPGGSQIAVACYVDGAVALVDARNGTVTTTGVGPNPRALTITNSPGTDADQTLFVTLMFGQPVASTTPTEGNDTGRQGLVIPVQVGALTAGTAVPLAPLADTSFKVADLASPPHIHVVGAYPNQLQAITLHNGRAYVASTAASPAGPLSFNANVHPLVSVFDLPSGTRPAFERSFDVSGTSAATPCGTSVDKRYGYAAGTLDLAVQIKDLNNNLGLDRYLFPTVPIDLDFDPGTDTAYVVSMAADIVQRVAWDYATNTACVGAPGAVQINLQPQGGGDDSIKVPIGIAVRNDGRFAYVNAWAAREVEVLDLGGQTVAARVPLSPQPTDPGLLSAQRGKRFFHTSTGRWSSAGWGSCGACHPDGLSDNVTYVFGTGPRQTLPLDAVFAKQADGVADPTDQRILNWTGIFDEIHDFESNTRGVSGGQGAVVGISGRRIDLAATRDTGVSGSVRALAADGATPRPIVNAATQEPVDTSIAGAWDDIERYIQGLRSLHHPRQLSASTAAVGRGRAQFSAGNCQYCHGGPKWTVSRLPYTPTQGAGTGSATCALQTTMLAGKSVPQTGLLAQNTDVFLLEAEHPGKLGCTAAGNQCSGIVGASCNATTSLCSVAPQRLTCPLRNVGTFGAGASGAAFEVRSDTTAGGASLQAEGAAGYNPPSLLSLTATAPYLHNGAAQTLTALLRDMTFRPHLTAGNPNYVPVDSEVADLVAFLQSIDHSTAPFPIDPGHDLCSGSYAADPAAVCTNP